MDAIDPLPTATAIAVIAAVASWVILLLFRAMLPSGILDAHMREQPAGARPVPQVGGLVVVPIYLVTLFFAATQAPDHRETLTVLGGSVALLWIVGLVDDHRHVPVVLRLLLQIGAALAVAFTLDAGFSLTGGLLPYWLERLLAALGLVYFINMTNFMDGLDLMTVVGLGLPLLFCLALLFSDPFGDPLGLGTLALVASLASFALFNYPPASAYLGDNGSLPLGLAAGALCLHLAADAGPVAAVLPFGYYLTDTASTLVMRLLAGENIVKAHSKHAYQVTRKAGRSEWWVILHVAALNLSLAVIARFSIGTGVVIQSIAAALGLGLCLILLFWFRSQRNG